MGTVESTLYGETPLPPAGNDVHRAEHTVRTHQHNDGTESIGSKNSTRSRTTTRSNASSKIKNQISPRKPNLSPKPQMKILRGSVVGSADTGKSSLLYRLRGEDDTIIIEKKITRRMMALIPWAPSNATSNKDMVQLHIVERHEGGYAEIKKKDRGNALDFIIFMIDRTNPQSLDFVIEFLNGLLEYHQRINVEKNSSSESNGVSSTSDYRQTLPLPSFCILLNHYDVTASSNTLTVKELKQSIATKIANHSSIHFDIKCIDACMKNGYGLQALNSFISLPYLQKKEYDLQLELRRIQNGLVDWNKSFDDNMDGLVSFDELETLRLESLKSTSDITTEEIPLVVEDASIATNDSRVSRNSRNTSDRGFVNEEVQDASKGSHNAEKLHAPLPRQANQKMGEEGRRRIMPPTGKDSKNGRKGFTKDASKKKKKKKEKSKKKSSKSSRSSRSERSESSSSRRSSQISEQQQRHVMPSNQRSRISEVPSQKRQTPNVVYNDPNKALEAFLASSDDESDDAGLERNNRIDTNAGSNAYSLKVAQSQYRNSNVLDSDDSDDDIGYRRIYGMKVPSAPVPAQPPVVTADSEDKNVEEQHDRSVRDSMKAINPDIDESESSSDEENYRRHDDISVQKETKVEDSVTSSRLVQSSQISKGESEDDTDGNHRHDLEVDEEGCHWKKFPSDDHEVAQVTTDTNEINNDAVSKEKVHKSNTNKGSSMEQTILDSDDDDDDVDGKADANKAASMEQSILDSDDDDFDSDVDEKANATEASAMEQTILDSDDVDDDDKPNAIKRPISDSDDDGSNDNCKGGVGEQENEPLTSSHDAEEKIQAAAEKDDDEDVSAHNTQAVSKENAKCVYKESDTNVKDLDTKQEKRGVVHELVSAEESDSDTIKGRNEDFTEPMSSGVDQTLEDDASSAVNVHVKKIINNSNLAQATKTPGEDQLSERREEEEYPTEPASPNAEQSMENDTSSVGSGRMEQLNNTSDLIQATEILEDGKVLQQQPGYDSHKVEVEKNYSQQTVSVEGALVATEETNSLHDAVSVDKEQEIVCSKHSDIVQGEAFTNDDSANDKSSLVNESDSKSDNASAFESKSIPGGQCIELTHSSFERDTDTESNRNDDATQFKRLDSEAVEENDYDGHINESESLSKAVSTKLGSYDDDDYGFIVTEQSDEMTSRTPFRKRVGYARVKEANDSSTNKGTEVKEDSGMSDAVRAAIAAAQQTAERMAQNEPEKKSKKKSSKKNKKSDKKKKKKKVVDKSD